MKKLGILMFAFILIGITMLSNVTNSLFAKQSEWIKLGDENYQILFKKNGNALVYTALQDSDKMKIAEEMDKNPGSENNWNNLRPDVIQPPTFKILTNENALEDVKAMEMFSVQYQDVDSINEAKFNVFNFDGNQVISPKDPEYSNFSYGFINSPDYRKGLVPTLSGLWLIDSNKKIKKITSDIHNGKKYTEIKVDFESKLSNSGLADHATVWWNNNPIFNNNGAKIVYTTNRDKIQNGGNSVWINDLISGKEQKILSSNDDFYNVLEWINDEQILAEKWSNGNRSYLISDTTGLFYSINLEGVNPEILGTYGEYIVYLSDYTTPNHLLVGEIDPENKSINIIYEKTIDGFVREWLDYVPFSEDGSKFGVLYLSDEQGKYDIILTDLTSKKEILIDRLPIEKARIQDFYWLDNGKLLIHLLEYEQAPAKVSSWTYNLEGGNN